jgi:choline dehydrogenase-like flavoprotein
MLEDRYDLIVVGTGFASSFFLHGFLERSPRRQRVLVLEAGQRKTHAERMKEGDPSKARARQEEAASQQFVNATPEKRWLFQTSFGGGSNCWYACCPRTSS